MDKKFEKSGHQKVLRRFAKRLKELGFEKYKSSFFLRQKGDLIQFVHLHKFTFATEYRIHLGIKLSDDKDNNFYLNGLVSSQYQCKDNSSGKKYNFSYHKTNETIERCVENLFQFCKVIGENWFNDWNDIDKLLKSPNSPLKVENRHFLKNQKI
jgi:hypothetical protein